MIKKPTFLLLAFISISTLLIASNPFPIEISGKISCNNQGISSVQVSDGVSVVTTDKKGQFRFESRSDCSFIFYSLPSGHESPIVDGIPVFYKKIDKTKKKQIANFEISKSTQSQHKQAFVIVGDPQVSNSDELNMLESYIADLKTTIDELSHQMPVIAISTGDNVFDKLALFSSYKSVISKTNIPFYQVIGNHDMDYNNRSDKLSSVTFSSQFGPTYYSYNIGNLHYVILKNVFYYGYSYHYMGYITENQLRWLEKDLSYVKKGSTVIVNYHIPTVYGESKEPDSYSTLIRNSVMNSDALYKILEPFNIHIMTGHSHTQWNTVISPKVFEHTHSAACSAWWQGPVGIDGTPKGYTVYIANGDSLSWYYKTVGLDKTEQFKLYKEGSDPLYPTSIIANVYNYDPAWTVTWFENDVPMGNMEQYWGEDPYAKSIYSSGQTTKYDWLSIGPTHHLFKAALKNSLSKIKVQVTDRFGNVYTKVLN